MLWKINKGLKISIMDKQKKTNSFCKAIIYNVGDGAKLPPRRNRVGSLTGTEPESTLKMTKKNLTYIYSGWSLTCCICTDKIDCY